MSMTNRLLSLIVLLLLLLAMITGLGPNTSTRFVQLGEAVWPGYASELRDAPTAPTCDREELKQRMATCATAPQPAAPEPADPFAEEDPFAEPAPKPTPAPEPVDPFAEEDPFAEPAPKPAPAPEPVDPFAEPAGDDPFAEPAPKPAPADDPFAEAPSAPQVNCAALATLQDRCDSRWASYEDASRRRTPLVASFSKIDSLISQVATFPWSKHLLVLLTLFGGLTTSVHRAHLALREAEHVTEHRIAHGAQLIAWLLWLASSIADWQVQAASSAESENAALPVLWALGFGVLALVELNHIVRPPEKTRSFNPLRALMAIPLFTWMVLIAGAWFLLGEGHRSGQAIFLHKFVQIPSIYLGIGLYIWAGMLLSNTRLARQVFDLLAPWKLPPALLGWLVVVLAALPTAYSGASGIFVIAAGAVIFERLTAAGAPPRLALIATAMSGSLGVVLRPCLVVVLVSVLDSNVTTDELFGWGLWVFALTSVLFLIAMILRHREPLQLPPIGEAVSGTMSAGKVLIPAAVLGLIGLFLYWAVLGTVVTEHTAALVLPGLLLALTVQDRWAAGEKIGPALTTATSTAAHHIGALLFVMAGSVGIGGVVERSEVMGLLPPDLGGPFPTMALLVVVMVLVGMTMDALGAVILVSVSLAHVAESNGIHPAHFWMMVLVAFELGYLTPPVALNHLLARQVIGEPAKVELLPADSWFERYEHILIPMAVMSTALVIVAFGPLLVA